MRAIRSIRRGLALFIPLVVVGAVSCAPVVSPPPPPPPPPTAVISVTSGPIGTFINVASPNSLCGTAGSYSQMQAALTRSNGVVLVNAYAYLGPSFSGNGASDAFVRLRVPATAAPGVHYVHLTCYSNYNEEFRYHPARFVVTAV